MKMYQPYIKPGTLVRVFAKDQYGLIIEETLDRVYYRVLVNNKIYDLNYFDFEELNQTYD